MPRHVTVIGSGPAGAFAALLLARRGVRVTVYDVRGPAEARAGIETLRGEVRALLQQHGIATCIASGVANPGTWSDWSGFGERHAITDLYGDDVHIDRALFREALIQHASAAGVCFRFHARALAQRVACGWTITAGTRREHADAIIIAAGRERSPLVGAPRREPLDRLVTVFATISAVSADGRLRLGTAPLGWWYACPNAAGATQLAFCSDGDLLKTALVTSNMVLSGASRIVSAVSLPPHDSVSADCLPVGDATGACDPMTGDGVLHALRSAASAVDALLQPPDCREASVAAYRAAMHDRFASYIGMRERIYATERRWVRFPFWQRRLTKQAARASEAVQ